METLNDLRIDDISYESYKRSFHERASVIGESFLVFSIVTFTLKFMFHLGDFTATDEFIDKQRGFLEYFEERLKDHEDEDERDSLIRCMEMLREKIASWPSEVKSNYALYEYFCENVVHRLLLERLRIELPEP
jgi:hypothetical protein